MTKYYINDNRFFILRNTPVLQLGIFLHNRYALLLRMETLATENVDIVLWRVEGV